MRDGGRISRAPGGDAGAGGPSATDRLVQRVRDLQTMASLVGNGPAFLRAVATLPLTARTDKAILITGETGTGKELVARAVHYLSNRAAFPFVPVNCGALPETLLQDELFGHERGAFTDAHARRAGLMAEASRGTLFLDEVDSLSPRAQVSLLRVLEEKRYRPVGASADREADVRVLAATNAPIEQRMADGSFRADLYYRLCVFQVRLPPLRERREDILPLAYHFLDKHALAPGLEFTNAARAAMLAFDWPGNVRELENAVIRGCHLGTEGHIGSEALNLPPAPLTDDALLPPSPPAARAGIGPMQPLKRQVVDEFEKQYLVTLITECCGNVSQAARAAHKERRELGKLLKKHHISPEQFTSPPAPPPIPHS